MPIYRSAGISVSLVTTSIDTLAVETHDHVKKPSVRPVTYEQWSTETTIQERPLTDDSNTSPVRFIGRNGDAPFFLVQALDTTHDMYHTAPTGPAQRRPSFIKSAMRSARPMALLVDLSKCHYFTDAKWRDSRNVKIEIFYNGELSSCFFLKNSNDHFKGTYQDSKQAFSGRRVAILAERPWVVAPRSGIIAMTAQDARRVDEHVWSSVAELLRNEAAERGINKYGMPTVVSDYLEAVARIPLPFFRRGSFQDEKWPGIIDLVISIGRGSKDSQEYSNIDTPTRLRDTRYVTESPQPLTQPCIATMRVQCPPEQPVSRVLKHEEVGAVVPGLSQSPLQVINEAGGSAAAHTLSQGSSFGFSGSHTPSIPEHGMDDPCSTSRLVCLKIKPQPGHIPPSVMRRNLLQIVQLQDRYGKRRNFSDPSRTGLLLPIVRPPCSSHMQVHARSLGRNSIRQSSSTPILNSSFLNLKTPVSRAASVDHSVPAANRTRTLSKAETRQLLVVPPVNPAARMSSQIHTPGLGGCQSQWPSKPQRAPSGLESMTATSQSSSDLSVLSSPLDFANFASRSSVHLDQSVSDIRRTRREPSLRSRAATRVSRVASQPRNSKAKAKEKCNPRWLPTMLTQKSIFTYADPAMLPEQVQIPMEVMNQHASEDGGRSIFGLGPKDIQREDGMLQHQSPRVVLRPVRKERPGQFA